MPLLKKPGQPENRLGPCQPCRISVPNNSITITHKSALQILAAKSKISQLVVITAWIVIVGPCSVHDYSGTWLRRFFAPASNLQEINTKDELFVVMANRLSAETPYGVVGWKGAWITDPNLDGSACNLEHALKRQRMLPAAWYQQAWSQQPQLNSLIRWFRCQYIAADRRLHLGRIGDGHGPWFTVACFQHDASVISKNVNTTANIKIAIGVKLRVTSFSYYLLSLR